MKSDDKPKKPTTRSTSAPQKTGATKMAATNAGAIKSAASNTSRSSTSRSKATASPALDGDGLEGEIRRRAYELYLSRGGDGGDQVADWLEAERMVRQAKSPRNASA
jgi:hypothetical protein